MDVDVSAGMHLQSDGLFVILPDPLNQAGQLHLGLM